MHYTRRDKVPEPLGKTANHTGLRRGQRGWPNFGHPAGGINGEPGEQKSTYREGSMSRGKMIFE